MYVIELVRSIVGFSGPHAKRTRNYFRDSNHFDVNMHYYGAFSSRAQGDVLIALPTRRPFWPTRDDGFLCVYRCANRADSDKRISFNRIIAVTTQ